MFRHWHIPRRAGRLSCSAQFQYPWRQLAVNRQHPQDHAQHHRTLTEPSWTRAINRSQRCGLSQDTKTLAVKTTSRRRRTYRFPELRPMWITTLRPERRPAKQIETLSQFDDRDKPNLNLQIDTASELLAQVIRKRFSDLNISTATLTIAGLLSEREAFPWSLHAPISPVATLVLLLAVTSLPGEFGGKVTLLRSRRRDGLELHPLGVDQMMGMPSWTMHAVHGARTEP